MSQNEQTGSSVIMSGVLAAVPAIAGFGVMKVVAGFDNWTAVLLGVMIWLAVTLFLVVAMHRPASRPVRLDRMAHPAPEKPAAPDPAAAPATPVMA